MSAIDGARRSRPRASSALTILEVLAVSKTYGTGAQAKLAIDEVSMTVDQREFVSIVGPSGAGKTTLLKCLAGLLAPTTGQVLFEGEEIHEPPPKMSLVFQDYGRSLFPWLTVEANVGLPLKGLKVAKRERRLRVGEALEAVGLPGVEANHPWQLSGGMQQRVALARALAYQPDCLVMDEPFASVDAQTRMDLEDLILRVRDRYGITVLFVTHDIDEAVYLSDRVVVLSRSPSRSIAEIDIPFGNARDQAATKADPRFGELRAELLGLVRGVRS